jgi:hypothetical protein
MIGSKRRPLIGSNQSAAKVATTDVRKKENARNPILIEDPEPDVEMVAPGTGIVQVAK